jgi:hypothetical protein
MNDETQLRPLKGVALPTDKPKRKRKSATLRAPRVIDPGVLEIRQEVAAKVREYHKAQASTRILKTIIDKLVPKLTNQDLEILANSLGKFARHDPDETEH